MNKGNAAAGVSGIEKVRAALRGTEEYKLTERAFLERAERVAVTGFRFEVEKAHPKPQVFVTVDYQDGAPETLHNPDITQPFQFNWTKLVSDLDLEKVRQRFGKSGLSTYNCKLDAVWGAAKTGSRPSFPDETRLQFRGIHGDAVLKQEERVRESIRTLLSSQKFREGFDTAYRAQAVRAFGELLQVYRDVPRPVFKQFLEHEQGQGIVRKLSEARSFRK